MNLHTFYSQVIVILEFAGFDGKFAFEQQVIRDEIL